MGALNDDMHWSQQQRKGSCLNGFLVLILITHEINFLPIVQADVSEERRSYSGYRIVQTQPKTKDQHWLIGELNHNGNVRVLGTGGAGATATGHLHRQRDTRSIVTLVAPEKWPATRRLMIEEGLEYDVMVDDFQRYIDDVDAETRSSSGRRSHVARKVQIRRKNRVAREAPPQPPPTPPKHHDSMDWSKLDKYHTSADIELFLSAVADQYAPIVELKDFGKSTEGRNLKAIHVKTNTRRTHVSVFKLNAMEDFLPKTKSSSHFLNKKNQIIFTFFEQKKQNHFHIFWTKKNKIIFTFFETKTKKFLFWKQFL